MALSAIWAEHQAAFTAFWDSSSAGVRKGLVTTSRDLLRTRTYGPKGEADASGGEFDLLLPDLSDDAVGALVATGSLLPELIKLRVEQPEAVAAHDNKFITAAASGAGLPEDVVARLAASRTSLYTSFLHDVVFLYVQSFKDASTANPSSDEAKKEEHDDSPVLKFARWFNDASEAGDVPDEGMPMTLATATKEGLPSARMVLLRAVTHDGFIFYTNYKSRKGQELLANPNAALLFYFPTLKRQVRVEGRVTKLAATLSDQYWNSRPLESRLSAWASHQSSVIPSREHLLGELDRARELFVSRVSKEPAASGEGLSEGGEAAAAEASPVVPRPEHWGGFIVSPGTVEFWKSGPFRLHDRLVYRPVEGEEAKWERVVLAP